MKLFSGGGRRLAIVASVACLISGLGITAESGISAAAGSGTHGGTMQVAFQSRPGRPLTRRSAMTPPAGTTCRCCSTGSTTTRATPRRWGPKAPRACRRSRRRQGLHDRHPSRDDVLQRQAGDRRRLRLQLLQDLQPRDQVARGQLLEPWSAAARRSRRTRLAPCPASRRSAPIRSRSR